MIKFFSKIRYKLMETGKTGRYFKYAIGEILLVVIGILIALQINNWNESRKDRQIETKALVALQLEFTESLNRINLLMKTKKNHENQARQYAQIISNDSLSIAEKVAVDAPGVNRRILAVNNSALKSLMNTGDFSKIKNDSLKTALNIWFNSIDMYLINEAQYEDVTIKRSNFLEDKFYQSIVNSGDYRTQSWPGNFYPNNLTDKNTALEAKFINSIEFYNINAQIVQRLYIQLMSLTKLEKENIEILKLINKELGTDMAGLPNYLVEYEPKEEGEMV